MEYTIDYVISKLAEDGIKTSNAILCKMINDNNFYARGLGRKESNGYDLGDGYTGRIWKLNENGVEELIYLCKRNKTGRGKDIKPRHRRTKAEMLLAQQEEKDKLDYQEITLRIRNETYENIMTCINHTNKDFGVYISELIDKDLSEKIDIINQIKELEKLL